MTADAFGRAVRAQDRRTEDTIMAVVTMRQLLESGVHFGHQTRRWNPKVRRFIFTERNGIYIVDLMQTLSYIDKAYDFVKQTVAHGGTILFVGTKKQAQEAIAEQATRVGQPYVNHRWLGGMLTNWKTITGSIKRLKQMETQLAGDTQGLTKKEVLMLTREKEKLDRALGGIKEMGGLPDIIFVIDTIKEKLAIEEANKLGIPVVAVCDSNADPQGVTYPIPGNDDAIRAINLYCDMVAGAVFDGISAELQASGVDLGAVEELPEEGLPEGTLPEELAGDVALEGEVQSSPTSGVSTADMETMVQANEDDGNRAG